MRNEPVRRTFSFIWMDPHLCRGCLNCELACSYHMSDHKAFNPSLSSIKVVRNNDEGSMSMTIYDTCDLCANEDIPQCIKYCSFGALGGKR
jgi:Fe-S-cluster-containing dehydrogenase component